MNKFIANSTAGYPLGLPTQQKCLLMKSGQYANRIVILYASSASAISLTWADPPYDSFSTPAAMVTDSADSPFDAFMNDDGDIYIAYTITGTKYLGFVKLTFTDGEWSAGTPATVYDGGESYYPSIRKLVSDYLWIAYTRLSGGDFYISAKSSGDDGATWGTVSDPGDTLTSGSSSAYGCMVEAGSYQYVFYSDGGTAIAYRRKLNAAVLWNSEVVLASGSGFDVRLAAAVSGDNRIGVAYADTDSLKFREYSGSTWSGEYVVEDIAVDHPAVSYQDGVPYVLFSREYGTDMRLVMYSRLAGTQFQSPTRLDGRKSYLQRLLVYDASAGTYQDKTGEASSTASGDIYHGTSGTLMSDDGDTVFFGMDDPFHLLTIVLSTVGSGGEVTWKYWDGQVWKSFTPSSGPWHFSGSPKTVLLWDDFESIPDDWQQKGIEGATKYWIAAAATTAFATAPVGSQITAIANLQALSVGV